MESQILWMRRERFWERGEEGRGGRERKCLRMCVSTHTPKFPGILKVPRTWFQGLTIPLSLRNCLTKHLYPNLFWINAALHKQKSIKGVVKLILYSGPTNIHSFCWEPKVTLLNRCWPNVDHFVLTRELNRSKWKWKCIKSKVIFSRYEKVKIKSFQGLYPVNGPYIWYVCHRKKDFWTIFNLPFYYWLT